MNNLATSGKSVSTKKSLFSLLYKNLLVIILAIVLGLLVGLGIGVLKEKPIYTESTSVMLLAEVDASNEDASNTQDMALSQYLLSDVNELLKSDNFVAVVNKSYKQNGGKGEIYSGAINVTYYNDESLIFSISYTDSDEVLAGKKLNAVVGEAKEYLKDKLVADNVELKETTNVNAKSVRYDYKIYLIIGAIVGLVIAVGYYLIRYLLDNTVKDKAEIEELTGVNVFACIEYTKSEENDNLFKKYTK